jgi:hypothetical protein
MLTAVPPSFQSTKRSPTAFALSMNRSPAASLRWWLKVSPKKRSTQSTSSARSAGVASWCAPDTALGARNVANR